jgi:hypothetical protein
MLICIAVQATSDTQASQAERWLAHDMNRPRPVSVTPAPLNLPVPPPSDAVVLFDGSDFSQWRNPDGGPPGWNLRDGSMETVPESGSIVSRVAFGDVQLHIEWSSPDPPRGRGQDRGNSGVYLMGLYEVQVLDSYQSDTYADGQAAAVYGQYPPLANASLPPGQWQSYDIFFSRPRFNSSGGLLSPARVTVIHNGVLVQNGVELWGPSRWLQHHPYLPHPDKLPLALQDHDSPVRFRNIWVRVLPERDPPPARQPANETILALSEEELERYTGIYERSDGDPFEIRREGRQLYLHVIGPPPLEMIAHSLTEFSLRWTAARLLFDRGATGKATRLTFQLGGETEQAKRIN